MSHSVSVIIPAYNGAAHIFGAVNSARSQTGVACKIIAVDDASTDNTVEVLTTLQKETPNLHIIRHEQNKGVSAARNTGIKEALNDPQCEYIALIDSDDLWFDSKLRLQLDDLAQSPAPDNSLSFTYYRRWTKSGRVRVDQEFLLDDKQDKYGNFINLRHYSDDEIKAGLIKLHLWFGSGSTMLAHRKVIEKNGFFEEKLSCGEDTEYIIRHLLRDGDVRAVPKFLMGYRVPDGVKIYPDRHVYGSYMACHYKCAIAQKFGGDIAKEFVRSIRFNQLSGQVPTGMWRTVAREVSLIGPDAPCRGDFDCPLRKQDCIL